MPLMVKKTQNRASAEEKVQFGQLWQERVEKILLGKGYWNIMITITSNFSRV